MQLGRDAAAAEDRDVGVHPRECFHGVRADERAEAAEDAAHLDDDGLRLRVERQLGYKQAKYVMRIELRETLVGLYGGKGGHWEDTRDYARPIEALSADAQQRLLPRTLLTALHRFRATGNIQDVAHTIRATCESESEHLDSELSMIRYIAWAIPSIGFLGTVRGIGQALGQAHQAAQGDIAGVTQSLGVAFNSTFVALLISILIMFLMHQLQLAQERTTQDTEQYCDNRLLRYLQV